MVEAGRFTEPQEAFEGCCKRSRSQAVRAAMSAAFAIECVSPEPEHIWRAAARSGTLHLERLVVQVPRRLTAAPVSIDGPIRRHPSVPDHSMHPVLVLQEASVLASRAPGGCGTRKSDARRCCPTPR